MKTTNEIREYEERMQRYSDYIAYTNKRIKALEKYKIEIKGRLKISSKNPIDLDEWNALIKEFDQRYDAENPRVDEVPRPVLPDARWIVDTYGCPVHHHGESGMICSCRGYWDETGACPGRFEYVAD
jgi:hypothetical protein